jgi:hypothetical protein
MAKAYLKPVDTEWPTVVQIAPSTKKLIHDYFEILDANTADAGEKLATRIFTKDATFKTSSASFIGYEGPLEPQEGPFRPLAAPNQQTQESGCEMADMQQKSRVRENTPGTQ